jgi:hypothetical protein
VCYEIASNFTPNKEGLFFIFPFVPNMFYSSCQQVPINNFIFLWKDHTRWWSKGFQLPLGGENEEREKNGGWGRGKTLWQLKGFWSPHWHGVYLFFGCCKIGDRKFSIVARLSTKICFWSLIITRITRVWPRIFLCSS